MSKPLEDNSTTTDRRQIVPNIDVWAPIGLFVLILALAIYKVILPGIPGPEYQKGVFSITIESITPEQSSKIRNLKEYDDWLSGNHFVRVDYDSVGVIRPVRADFELRFCSNEGVEIFNGAITAYYRYEMSDMIAACILAFIFSLIFGPVLWFQIIRYPTRSA